MWALSGLTAAAACAAAKWILVVRKKDGGTVQIWSKSVLMDTVGQAFKTWGRIWSKSEPYFIETMGGSVLFAVWMKAMGSKVDVSGGVYVDSMGAALNLETVEIEGGNCVVREALLFGHIFEGGGKRERESRERKGSYGRGEIAIRVLKNEK